MEPLYPKIKNFNRGLDFGSGPGPTISAMLLEKGIQVTNYDLHFAPDALALQKTYPFITCTETVEHFANPRREFLLFDRLLRKGGWLGIMTGTFQGDEHFKDWYYHRDPTHICFYSRDTMKWIAQWRGWKIETPARDITLFFKPDGESSWNNPG